MSRKFIRKNPGDPSNPTTVAILGKFCDFEGDWDKKTFSKEGWTLEWVKVSGSGAGDHKEINDHFHEVINGIEFHMANRSFTRVFDKKIPGKKFGKTRKLLLERFPNFTNWYIREMKIKNSEGLKLLFKSKFDPKEKELLMVCTHYNKEEIRHDHVLPAMFALDELFYRQCERTKCTHTPEYICSMPRQE